MSDQKAVNRKITDNTMAKMNSCTPEWSAVPAPLVTPVLTNTRREISI